MAIRRPNHMVLKASKTGKVKVVYESEHKYLSEDYQRLHGGFLLTSEVQDDDGLIVPQRHPERIEGEVLKHVGPVPLPRNVSHPWEFPDTPYGRELAEQIVVQEDPETHERVVQLPERLMRDVLSALEAADSTEE